MTVNTGVSMVITSQSYGKKTIQDQGIASEKADYRSIIQQTADMTQSTSDSASFLKMQTVPTQKSTETYSGNTPTKCSSSIFTVIYRMKEHIKAFSDASTKLESLIKAYDINPQSLSQANVDVSTYSQALHEDSQLLKKAADDLRSYLHLQSNKIKNT